MQVRILWLNYTYCYITFEKYGHVTPHMTNKHVINHVKKLAIMSHFRIGF